MAVVLPFQFNRIPTAVERLNAVQHSHKLFKEHLEAPNSKNLSIEEKQLKADSHIAIPLIYRLTPEETSLQFVKPIALPCSAHMHDRRLGRAVDAFLNSGGNSPLNWIQQLASPSTLFIDVGANLGIYTAFALAWGYSHSLCVEPHPENYMHLLKLAMCNEGLITPLCAAIQPDSEVPFAEISSNMSFSGISHLKLNDKSDDKPRFSSIVPSMNYRSLLSLFNNTTPNMKTNLSESVLKIDTDNNDFEHVYALIKLGVASNFKAIIFEHAADSGISVEEISRDANEAGLYIASKSSNDILLLPFK